MRPESDMTAAGAAYMAGLSCGFWKDYKELMRPCIRAMKVLSRLCGKKTGLQKKREWKKVLKRLLDLKL